MALSSGSTLQQSDEVASVVATAADGGGGAAVSVVQNEVVAFPSAGSPDRFRVSDTTAPESPIQDAIDYAANQGSGRVVLGSAVVEGGYDPTSVTFDPSVKMEVGAAQKSGWNVKAYGAAGDESVKKDDYAAFQAAHDQAKAYAETIYSGNGRKITLVVPATRDGSQYYLSQPWELTASSLEVQGGGRYSCVVNPHSNFDDTTYESVVRMGKNSEGTNAVTIRDLNIDGRGKEISALKTDITFSGWIQDCTLRSGEYNSSGLGRRVAGLHVYGAKNLWTANCQISTSVGAGVLVDHRGNSGSTIQTGFLGFHDVQITENDYGGIVTRTGAFHIEVQSCSLAVNGDPADGLEAGHQVYIESGSSYHMNGGEVDNGYYGCYTSIGGGAQVKYRGVDFRGLRKQSVIEDASGNTLFQLHNCDFSNTGKDHDPNGSINGDYTSSTKIADVHIRNCFDGQYNIQDNSHNQDTDPDRFYGILNAVGTFSDISSSPPTNFLLVSGNVSPRGGYRATDGSRIKPGETYTNLPGNPHGGIFGKTGEEAAGVGNTPTRADWRIGDVVENTDDNRLFYLKKDGTWFDFSKEQVSFDKGNDGTPDIQGVNQISSQNDPRNIWSVGPGTNELLVDGDPVAYRQEDETITGQWEYEQEIDWTSQINGVGYEGYLQIPVDTPSQTEYILISKLDSNGNNQKLTADLFVGRRTNTSVNNSGHIRVYWNQNGDGSNRNFATETLMDVEGANEVFDVRPVEVTYNSEKWAAVEVSVGFGNIEWRTLQAHHTGNYSLSVIESKSSSNVSNVTFWGDSSEGSLGRQELYAERLQHNASQSHGFTSGFTGSGWLVNTTGPQGKPDKIEAGHMVLRGTLRVRELILEQLRVRKGIQIISAGGGKLEKVEAENFGSPVDADVGEFNAWDIVGVDTAANTLTVDNSTVTPDPNTLVQDQRSLIDGSTGNDDNYTVSSVTDNGDGTSDIVMNESVPDSTADGRVWEATKQRFFFEDPNDTASASGLVAGDRILAQRFDPESQTVVAQIRRDAPDGVWRHSRPDRRGK